MAQQKVLIKIPPGFAPDIREDIARNIITFIRDRTATEQTGYNPGTGRNYSLRNKKYSKAYAEKKGVGVSDVDLLLSGDMLDAIEVLRITPTSITVGFEAGSKENDKAEGNQKGSYGASPDSSKARPFLGLTKGDLDRILDNYERDSGS